MKHVLLRKCLTSLKVLYHEAKRINTAENLFNFNREKIDLVEKALDNIVRFCGLVYLKDKQKIFS